jgi:hypothetical protein
MSRFHNVTCVRDENKIIVDYSVSDYKHFLSTPLNQKSRIYCMDNCVAINPKPNY